MAAAGRVKIVVPDDYNDVYGAAPAFEPLRARAQIAIYTAPAASLDEWVARIGDAPIIVANRERIPLGAGLFDRLPHLEMIAQTGGGGSHLDLPAATVRGIFVTGTGGGSA